MVRPGVLNQQLRLSQSLGEAMKLSQLLCLLLVFSLVSLHRSLLFPLFFHKTLLYLQRCSTLLLFLLPMIFHIQVICNQACFQNVKLLLNPKYISHDKPVWTSYFPAAGPDLWSLKMWTSGKRLLKIPRAANLMECSKSEETLAEKVQPRIFFTIPSSTHWTAWSREI